jgi:subtilisin family serine protease
MTDAFSQDHTFDISSSTDVVASTANAYGLSELSKGEFSGVGSSEAELFEATLEVNTFKSELENGYGIFSVGESGEVAIDFLFDGGRYKSELGIFSLDGMEDYASDPLLFAKEAATRALSDSLLGHIVVSDRAQAARFSGHMEASEDRDWNSGEYLAQPTFAMTPGDEFAFILMPKGGLAQVLEEGDISQAPLFSIAAANPGGDIQFADVTGDSKAFSFEDLSIDKGSSDQDFNDIIFQIEGATGKAFGLGTVKESLTDWQQSDVGQVVIEAIVDPEDLAGNTPDAAYRSSPSTAGKVYRGWVGKNDPVDYYSFSLGMQNDFRLEIDGLSKDINVQVLDLSGNIAYTLTTEATQPGMVEGILEAGAYRIRVSSKDNLSTAYDLKLAVEPTVEGITTTGSDQTISPTTTESLELINLNAFRSGSSSLGSNFRFRNIDGGNFSAVVIDSGIDLDHPWFEGQIPFSFDFVGDDDNNGDNTGGDLTGHGTHVAGIINSVAPGADIISLRVLGTGEEGDSGSFSDIEQALQWVIENAEDFNISSVNMSLGVGIEDENGEIRDENQDGIPDEGNYNFLEGRFGLGDELQRLDNMGVIVVAAAGNDYFTFKSAGAPAGINYPAADPNTISVGAVWDANNSGPYAWPSGANDNTTSADRIVSFSQRHPEILDVFAPGAIITSAGLGGGTTDNSGTSMASPHIAGIAVLAQQLAEQELELRLTPDEFRQVLQETGVPIFDGDDEDDNVENTDAWYRRVDILALANRLVGWNLSASDKHFVGDFDGDGRDDILARKSDALGLLSFDNLEFKNRTIQVDHIPGYNPNQFGGNVFWRLNSTDQHFVGDFDGDGRDDVFVRSPEWAGMLSFNGNNFRNRTIQYKTIPGKFKASDTWHLGSGDQHSIGDFTGDGKDDVMIRSGNQVGILTFNGNEFETFELRNDFVPGRNPYQFDGNIFWRLNTGDQHFTGDFDRTNLIDESFVRSPEWVGMLAQNRIALNNKTIQHEIIPGYNPSQGDVFWRLNSTDKHFVGDFNGDGGDEVFIRSPDWAGMLEFNGIEFENKTIQNQTIPGLFKDNDTWWLASEDQHFVGDFNNDGKDDVFIRSDNWAGILIYDGTEFRNFEIRNNTVPGSHPFQFDGNIFWRLNPTDRHFVGDFDGDGQDEIFVRSPEWAGMLELNGRSLRNRTIQHLDIQAGYRL